jgi:hypothetical protein
MELAAKKREVEKLDAKRKEEKRFEAERERRWSEMFQAAKDNAVMMAEVKKLAQTTA